MRNNETGEYELVVGNKQLLSGFFIVVVLCAVAFAMGYVVGQNSPRTAKLSSEQPAQAGMAQDARPQPASPAAPAAAPSNSPASQPDASSPAAQTDSGTAGAAPAQPPQPTTQPARDSANPAPAQTAAPAVSAADAPPGTCWQVLSTKNPEAARDVMQTLKDKGFSAALSPGPNGYTRVLVGPYTDTAAMGRAKTALEAAGFQPVRK